MASTLQKAQMYDDRVHGTRKVKVTILASEWGSSNVGLSTLNRELAIQLAKFPEVEITFFLPKCSQQDKKVALEYNVKIVQAKPVPGMEQLYWLCFPPDDLEIDIIVGHGAELGSLAYTIKRNKKCKWVQVVHSDPEELGMFKNNSNPILKGEKKHKTEVELCEMADHVVGVGGKLSEAFRSYLRGCNKDDNVFDFTPGLFEEFGTVKQVPSERQQRSVLVFGGGDAEDFELKGFDIAGKAIAALQDTRLVFVGVTDGKREEIAKRLTGCGIPASRSRVRGFVQDQDSLKRLFQEVDLVLMPSRTEGFGLPGLEAMSAGLPVLVSHNSGFGEALSSVPFGSFFVVNSENPADWTQAIQKIWAKDRKSRLEEVETLQDSYGKKYSWAKQMKDLVDKMTSLAYEDSLKAASSLETKFNASSQRKEGMIEDHKEPSMENDNNPRTNSSDDEQLLPETSIGSNREKKADAALGNQTEISTNKGSQSQNSRKRKMAESSCDQGPSGRVKQAGTSTSFVTGSQQDASTATDDVGASAGAKSPDHLNQTPLAPVNHDVHVIETKETSVNVTVWHALQTNGPISDYQVLVQKVNDWCNEVSDWKTLESDVYIAAQIPANSVNPSMVFEIGDGKTYDGYENKQLSNGLKYKIYSRGLSRRATKKRSVDQNYLLGRASLIAKVQIEKDRQGGDTGSQSWDKPSNTASVVSSVVLGIALVISLGVNLYQWRARGISKSGKKYSAEEFQVKAQQIEGGVAEVPSPQVETFYMELRPTPIQQTSEYGSLMKNPEGDSDDAKMEQDYANTAFHRLPKPRENEVSQNM